MKTCIVPVCSVSPLHTQSELNGSSYNIRHTDHSEVVRVAGVYRAFLTHICREQRVTINKDHLFSTETRVVVSSVDHVAAFHIALIAQPEVWLANHDDGSIRMSGAECSVKVLMSLREVFRVGRVVVVIHDEHDRV